VYSFIAGFGLRPLSSETGLSTIALLQSAGRDVVAQMPDLGSPLSVDVVHLPEMEGGWAMIRPEAALRPLLVSDAGDANHACLVFGQLDASIEPAPLALREFVRGGPRAVTALGGVFSAIVVERRARRVHVVTSLPGSRSLHYWTERDLIAISPLDLGIVALTRCPVSTDPASLAVLLACGWPLGGARALKGVRESRPDEVIHWEAGRCSAQSFNPLTERPRLAAKDSPGVARQVDAVIDELRASVAQQLQYFGPLPIRVPLTAGIDSRAVLALLLSILSANDIRTYTRGAESQDVRVARRISGRLGIQHETLPIEPGLTEAFLGNARFVATMTNGTGNADTALVAPFRVSQSPVPLGGGGEVFRGYYYNYLRRQRHGTSGKAAALRALSSYPLARLRTKQFASEELDAAGLLRLEETLLNLESLSKDAFDLLDLFYIFERMGQWGSTIWRRALGPTFMPFANHRAMSLAFQLPPPVGDHAIVASIIRRFAPPWAFWIPVNGAEFLFLQGPGQARYAARELLRGSAIVVRNARRRLFQAERTPRQSRIAHMEGALREPIVDSLRAANSVARDLFSPQRIDQLSSQRGGVLSELSQLGAVLSLDLWRAELQGMHSRPRSVV
jgi:hypothetical protein